MFRSVYARRKTLLEGGLSRRDFSVRRFWLRRSILWEIKALGPISQSWLVERSPWEVLRTPLWGLGPLGPFCLGDCVSGRLCFLWKRLARQGLSEGVCQADVSARLFVASLEALPSPELLSEC